jgi:hypothetical protein
MRLVFNLIHRGTSPILQEQNALSPVADEVEIGEESPLIRIPEKCCPLWGPPG